MPSRKRRVRNARRRQVDRTERVLPTPEAAQHHRAWPMQELLARGAKDGGLDADEFEAAVEIVETFKVLVADLDVHGTFSGEARGVSGGEHGFMSDRNAERCAVWFEWSMHLPRGMPTRLVAEIEDEQPISSVAELLHACRRWLKVKHDRSRVVDNHPSAVLTLPLAEVRPSGTSRHAPPPSSRSAPTPLIMRAAPGRRR